MFILSYYGGSRSFEKLGNSFCYSLHKEVGSRFHNGTFGRLITDDRSISKKYRHVLVLDSGPRDPLKYSLCISRRMRGLGVFTPHFMRIECLDRQAMQRLFSHGIAFSWHYEIIGSDSKLVHPFLRMNNEEDYKDLCKTIRDAKDEYMRKLPDIFVKGKRVPKGVASPFYVLQFRANKEVEVMFFIGGAVDGNE